MRTVPSLERYAVAGQLSLVSAKGRGTTARLDFPPDGTIGRDTRAA